MDHPDPRLFFPTWILGWCMRCSGSFPVELTHGWILISGKWVVDVSDSHPSGQKGIPSVESLQAAQALSFCKWNLQCCISLASVLKCHCICNMVYFWMACRCLYKWLMMWIYIFFTRKQHQIFLQFVFFNFIFGIYSREDTETKGAGIFSVFGFYLDIMS